MRALRRLPPLAALLLCACATTFGGGRVETRVRVALEELIAAQNEGNVPLVLSFFSDDAILLPPAGPEIRGISAVADHYRRLVSEQKIDSAIRIDELEVDRELAWARARVVGYLTSRSTGGEVRLDDEWLAVLRRSGDEWQIAGLMWRGE